MSGDLTYFQEGREIPAKLVGDENGVVAERGEAVEIVGESLVLTEVALCQTAGNAIGNVHQEPLGGDGTGRSTIQLGDNPIDWYRLADGWDQTAADPSTTSASAGDLAIVDVGGALVKYAGQPAGPKGRVFATNTRNEVYRDGKAAIIVFR